MKNMGSYESEYSETIWKFQINKNKKLIHVGKSMRKLEFKKLKFLFRQNKTSFWVIYM